MHQGKWTKRKPDSRIPSYRCPLHIKIKERDDEAKYKSILINITIVFFSINAFRRKSKSVDEKKKCPHA
ncbi:hypothetical protein J41TS8_25790 [Bacillus sp. J41TS8]|nr:hypothetical protein J41TS8_25790 [Bacillus sp. J41TS8]